MRDDVTRDGPRRRSSAARPAAGPAGWQRYYAIVRRIPRASIATYGQIAALAGRPRAARQVGYALAALRNARPRGRDAVPWHRVLGKRAGAYAGISILDAMGAAVQRLLLTKEGVAVDERGRVSLEEFGWEPSRRRRAGRRAGGAVERER